MSNERGGLKHTLQRRINHTWSSWSINGKSKTFKRRSWHNAFYTTPTPISSSRRWRIGIRKIPTEKRIRSGRTV